jgi:hypothetical protein
MTSSGVSSVQAWDAWIQEAAGIGGRVQAASSELAELFVRVAQRTQLVARGVSDSALRREMQQPRVDLEEVSARFTAQGPGALSRRERRALISVPGHLNDRALHTLLGASPELVDHATRVCLTHWPRYLAEPWGASYEAAVLTTRRTSSSVLRVELPIRSLLARSDPDGAAFVASQLAGRHVSQVYDYVRNSLGIRDSWLFSSSVLAAWFAAKLRDGRSFLDPELEGILGHERLRALLLPASRNAKDAPPVRAHVPTQARVVATALGAAFAAPPRILGATLSRLVSHLLGSTFLDPRDALRTEGWLEVSRLNEHGFRRLLTSLCEQDLDVFFQHAMNEPDRRSFWLRYLSSLERTGCVLDRSVRKSLSVKLQALPEVRGAIDRAHAFKQASGVQAFLLVFPNVVVVEFSDTGNAAYVYTREFFAAEIEPLLRSGSLPNHNALKRPDKAMHRILHGGRWQGSASDWLAGEGVHAR